MLNLTQKPKRNTSRGKEGGKKKTAAKTGISLPPFPLRFSSLDSLFPLPFSSTHCRFLLSPDTQAKSGYRTGNLYCAVTFVGGCRGRCLHRPATLCIPPFCRGCLRQPAYLTVIVHILRTPDATLGTFAAHNKRTAKGGPCKRYIHGDTINSAFRIPN